MARHCPARADTVKRNLRRAHFRANSARRTARHRQGQKAHPPPCAHARKSQAIFTPQDHVYQPIKMVKKTGKIPCRAARFPRRFSIQFFR